MSECVSAPNYELGPGGLNCSELVAAEYCNSTGPGPAWQEAAWGSLDRFQVDGLTPSEACCGCGREAYLNRLALEQDADENGCAWLPSNNTPGALVYSCTVEAAKFTTQVSSAFEVACWVFALVGAATICSSVIAYALMRCRGGGSAIVAMSSKRSSRPLVSSS
mmetsp:Transcript_20687/g.30459  ORF Transcript_20687/g.30459 Transcript_20687/m.30459 type:complete len:164 (+) Transcript_20687:145-636(+)